MRVAWFHDVQEWSVRAAVGRGGHLGQVGAAVAAGPAPPRRRSALPPEGASTSFLSFT